jgi:hypothetical protein
MGRRIRQAGSTPALDRDERSAARLAGIHPLLSLQRTAGNRAVCQLLAGGADSGVPQVGRADDPAERDAERRAGPILAALGHAGTFSSGRSADRQTPLSRPESATVSQDTVRRLAPPGAAGPEGGPLPKELGRRLGSGGPGRRLPDPVLGDMETATGTDLSAVRVHEASDLPGLIGAAAFTVDSEIYLGPDAGDLAGGYRQEVLAHEVAHVIQGEPVIRRYFEKWPASDADAARKARFVAFVENAVTAGIPADAAEGAGKATLQHWDGWSHPSLGDFDYPWITGPGGFRKALEERLRERDAPREALKTLLDEVFKDQADQALLGPLGQAAGFTPGGQGPEERLQLDPEWEQRFVSSVAARFEKRGGQGQGALFEAAWEHASDAQKLRILDIIYGPGWHEEGHQSPSAHLSDMSYLVEGVTGKTPGSPSDILTWAKNPRQSLFDYMAALTSGYRTKYLTEDERQAYRLTIGPSRISLPSGPLVGDNIFVLGADNVFYGGAKRSGRGTSQDSGVIHHSSFMAGEPVQGAGHFTTDKFGKLRDVSYQSGHYAPGDYELGLVLYHLEDCRSDLGGVTVNGKSSAKDFLGVWKKQHLPDEPEYALAETTF